MGIPQNGWFISWKIPSRNGWWLGVPLFQETSVLFWTKWQRLDCDLTGIIGIKGNHSNIGEVLFGEGKACFFAGDHDHDFYYHYYYYYYSILFKHYLILFNTIQYYSKLARHISYYLIIFNIIWCNIT